MLEGISFPPGGSCECGNELAARTPGQMGGAGRRGGGGRNRRRGICDRPRPGNARASRPDHGAAAGRGRQAPRAATPAALPPAMPATVQEAASLGLPDLPGSSDPLSGLSLLSGTHTFKIAYDGPAKVRVAVPVSMGETDVRRDGRNVWLWDSQTNKATHYILPAGAADTPPNVAQAQRVPTPPQLAKQILAAVGSTTKVGLQQNVTVAGQPAYQLSLAPKDSRSLIGQVRIAIDASNSLPLQVQVFARGAASPAFSVGYTSLSYARPAASNFAFSPPPGAKVKTVTVPAGLPAGSVGLGGVLPNLPAGSFYNSVKVAPPPPGSVTFRMSAGSGKVTTVTGGKRLPAAVRKQLIAAMAKSLP